ncbi:MAG: SDR family NAD(P)-dependent oxidoreductase, partial [Gammaproteobacteria bacterium]
MQISGKTALVTGGTDGIGLEIARQLKAKGADLTVCGRRENMLASARAEGLGAIRADLSNAEGCAAFLQQFNDRPLDILINNAGMGGNFGPGDPLDLALTDKAIFLNLNAPMHLIGQLLPNLLARPEAAIVNVTSGLAIAPRAGGPVYCASKAGLRSFTQSLRHN